MQTLTFVKDRPIIGLTGPSTFSGECMSMIETFMEANPIMLYHQDLSNIETLLKLCDAVVLAGGVDIHPRTYGENIPTGKNIKGTDWRRDRREIAVIDHCIDNGIPILGICRGHQLLGVYRMKMDVNPDVCADSEIVHSASRQEPKLDVDIYTSMHNILVEDGSDYPGEDTLWVNSFHHQGLVHDKAKCKGLDAVGTAYVDGKNGTGPPRNPLASSCNGSRTSTFVRPAANWAN
jgi:gamma-glutamyl-gamma-aminobutyrate hydrolase PuuD